MNALVNLQNRLRARLPELKALARGPVFATYLSKVKASVIAMAAHLAFMTLLLEPAVKVFFPPPEKKSGLAALFGGGDDGPHPHEEILAWLDPVLWILGWAAFGIFLERSIKPALARARQKSKDLEVEGTRALARGEVLAGLQLLEKAQAISPDEPEQARLGGTLAQVRSTTAPIPLTKPAAVENQTVAGGSTAQLRTMASGRITLEGLLGEGAMGRVFAGTDQLLGRRLAVKELAQGVAGNDEYRERFLREARVLARLSHPNIVQVFDLLVEGTGHFLCMELVEGSSLEAELRRKERFDVRDAAGLGRQIASALAYAHGRGVVHRDLKPANVLVTADGIVKVVDFGVARLVDNKVTRTGVIFGTPLYMAPEQIQGGQVDDRADLYALGVVLYELVAGKPPFDGTLVTLLARHLNEPAPALEVDPNDPAATGYAALVAELLAKDPAQRPASAELVGARLGDLVKASAA